MAVKIILRSCFEMITLVFYVPFLAISTFLISHVVAATLLLRKPELSQKATIAHFGNHFKTTSKN